MSDLTLDIIKNDGSNTEVNPILNGTTTNRTCTVKVGKVQPDGTTLDVTMNLPAFTPLPGTE